MQQRFFLFITSLFFVNFASMLSARFSNKVVSYQEFSKDVKQLKFVLDLIGMHKGKQYCEPFREKILQLESHVGMLIESDRNLSYLRMDIVYGRDNNGQEQIDQILLNHSTLLRNATREASGIIQSLCDSLEAERSLICPIESFRKLYETKKEISRCLHDKNCQSLHDLMHKSSQQLRQVEVDIRAILA